MRKFLYRALGAKKVAQRCSQGVLATARRRQRKLQHESLEQRMLLTADITAQNPVQPLDVNGDARVTALDALIVLNHLNRVGPGPISKPTAVGFLDATGSGSVTAKDPLIILNALYAREALIGARLLEDGGPEGIYQRDFVSNQYGFEIAVTNRRNEPVEIRINGDTNDPFVDIDSWLTAGGIFDEQTIDTIAGSPLADGNHVVEIRHAGETVSLSFTLDRQSPTLAIDPFSKSPDGEVRPLIIDFGKAMPFTVFDVSNYSVTRGEGEFVQITDVIPDGNDRVRIFVDSDSVNVGSYSLNLDSRISDRAGNSTQITKMDFNVGERIDFIGMDIPGITGNKAPWEIFSHDFSGSRTFGSNWGGGLLLGTWETSWFQFSGRLDNHYPKIFNAFMLGDFFDQSNPITVQFFNDAGLSTLEYVLTNAAFREVKATVDTRTSDQALDVRLTPRYLSIRARGFDPITGEPQPWVSESFDFAENFYP